MSVQDTRKTKATLILACNIMESVGVRKVKLMLPGMAYRIIVLMANSKHAHWCAINRVLGAQKQTMFINCLNNLMGLGADICF